MAYVDYLARNGFVVFKIDLRGHGESEGEPTGSYFSPGYTVDAIAALKSLQTLAIDERVYGPDRPDVATDVNNLGGALRELGDLAGARAAFERALAILEKFLPEGHPNIESERSNLEKVKRAIEDHGLEVAHLESLTT